MCGSRALKRIRTAHVESFWADPDIEHLSDASGCYVFCLKSGRGFSPWYVGKATRGFGKEVFTDHKLTRYNDVVYAGHKGTPVMFFVVAPTGKSKKLDRQIDELETTLIRAAVWKNERLLNKAKRGAHPWGIRGVVHGGHAVDREGTKAFRVMMGM